MKHVLAPKNLEAAQADTAAAREADMAVANEDMVAAREDMAAVVKGAMAVAREDIVAAAGEDGEGNRL